MIHAEATDDLSDEQLHHSEQRTRTGKHRLGFVGAIVAAVLLWLK